MQWDRSGDHGAGPGAVRGQDLVVALVNWEPKEGFVWGQDMA